jgi:hypothetical protein
MTERQAQLDALAAWITSADARAAAAAELRGRALPDLVDDVCQQTFVLVAARIDRHGPIVFEGEATMASYARRAMRNLVTGMVRGRRVDPFEAVPEAVSPEITDAVVDVIAGAEAVDAIRHALFTALVPKRVWSTSAALSFVTLAVDPGRRESLGPTPEAGAEGQWRYWMALWLAGDRDSFAADDAATRQRRSRAIKQINAELQRAMEPTS